VIDARRKTARETLDALKNEIRAPLDRWEAEDEARKTRIKTKIAAAFGPKALPASSTDLIAMRDHAAAIEIDGFEEFTSEAAKAKDHFLEYLAKKIEDAEAAEAAVERRRQEMKEARKAAEEAIRKAAEERAAREAEQAENARLRAELEAMKQAALPIGPSPVVIINDLAPEQVRKAASDVMPALSEVPVHHSPQARREATAAVVKVLNQCHTIHAMADEVIEAIWNGEIPFVSPMARVEAFVS
jgi:hypothetical protein